MKKKLIISIILTLSFFNLLGVFTQTTSANDNGGLKCDQLIGCTSTAGCTHKGSPTGCQITCDDGVLVDCPRG